jgi:hypothetical protein
MKAIHTSGARGRTWALIEGDESDTDARAIETAEEAYGGEWAIPIMDTVRQWRNNPKPLQNKGKWLWLLVKKEVVNE